MFDRNKNKQAESKTAEPVSTPARARSTNASAVTVRNVAMIGPSIRVKGEVSGDEDLLIQGRVEGTIDLGEREVTVGETGQVLAELRARNIKIDGEVTGDITGGDCVIVSKLGNVRGNIVAPRVILEDGAKFKGNIDMDPAEAASKPVAVGGQASAPATLSGGKKPELDLKSGKA